MKLALIDIEPLEKRLEILMNSGAKSHIAESIQFAKIDTLKDVINISTNLSKEQLHKLEFFDEMKKSLSKTLMFIDPETYEKEIRKINTLLSNYESKSNQL